MFVPVACSQCGKPFQVPDSAAGKPTPCPWCQAIVAALPVAAATPQAANAQPVPLSLDDEPPVARARARRWPILVMLLLVGAAATTATIGVLRYKGGYGLSREWRAFTPQDHSCSIDMLGRPTEDSDAPEGGGRRYSSEGWYSGTTTSIGWRNLNAAEVQLAGTNEAWHDAKLMKLFDAERDRLIGIHGGYVAKDGTIEFKAPLTRELRLELPKGRLVERMIVIPTGPRPRIYYLGIAGKHLDPDGEEVKRFFDSFHVLDS